RLDDQVSRTVLVDVLGAAGHRLDFAGAPVGGASGITGPGVVEPIGGVEPGVRGTVEVVGEDLCPAGWCGWKRGLRRRRRGEPGGGRGERGERDRTAARTPSGRR